MLDEKDLHAIAQMMDTKLSQQKRDILDETSQQIQGIKAEILDETSQQMQSMKAEILDETTHRMKVLLNTEVQTKFNLLAEGQQDILNQLVPRSRVEELEDEVKFLKSVVRQINDEVQALKKAN